MKILFVVAHLRKGGPVDVMYNICRQVLHSSDSTIKIVTLRPEGENSKIEEFRKLGIEVFPFNFSYWQCELLTGHITKRIQQLVEQENIDIVHAHTYHPVLACAQLKGVKKISTLHNRATEDFLNVYGSIMGRYMLARYFKALQTFDANIAVSQSAYELYQSYIPHVGWVNNGVDTTTFQVVNTADSLSLREKLGVSATAKIFVSTGRIEKEKGYIPLIEWFGRVSVHANALLLILGDGRQLQECKEVAAKNPKIIFTGRVDNVADYLQCADYYISNSQSEGMSMAVCEGIACGLYPILSNIPSHVDVAKGVDGFLFEQPDDIDLRKVLVSKHDRQSLHRYIESYFSIQSMGDGYLKVYHSLKRKNLHLTS
ncbi:MAG: glycosyltransferase family 4 protein [Prevotellaceae bacterium]|nr:glycosyltransferase family 4 protein [Prevotellaceae bacterium]MDY3365236.1 glycosyltransferase family 4 protein [Prevotella sp.]